MCPSFQLPNRHPEPVAQFLKLERLSGFVIKARAQRHDFVQPE